MCAHKINFRQFEYKHHRLFFIHTHTAKSMGLNRKNFVFLKLCRFHGTCIYLAAPPREIDVVFLLRPLKPHAQTVFQEGGDETETS